MTAAPDGSPERDAIEVLCAAAGLTLLVPRGTSILDAVRRAGLVVPGACADGRCGACETRVLDGVPEHRDGVLSEEERGVGETMMLCVSGATGSSLVLDL